MTVCPLTSSIPYEELTYFSSIALSPGDLVEIDIRKRKVRALVINLEPLIEQKQSIKNASFVTKKITICLVRSFLAPKLWQGIVYGASCTLKTPGEIIYDFLSERSFDIPHKLWKESKDQTENKEISVLLESHEHRMTMYRSLIREMFSKKKSVVLFLPTIKDIENITTHLIKGIEEKFVVLHSDLSDKEYASSIEKISTIKTPLLIISTPSIVPFIKHDVGYIVLEKENSNHYYRYGKVSYDMRVIIESIAQHINIPCLFGSSFLSLRAHVLYSQREAFALMPPKYRNDAYVTVVDMKDNKSKNPYFGEEALLLLQASHDRKRGHIVVFCHRKGMYPTTVCSDCGALYECSSCNRPYVLHKINNVRTFVCHSCNDLKRIEEDKNIICSHCGSWRLFTLGVASGGIEEALKEIHMPVFCIDAERTSTKTKALKVYKEWKKAEYGVLLGTEMILPFLKESEADAVIVSSLDSLFSLPEYRVDEKILSLITELSEKVKERDPKYMTFILQTRMKTLPIISHVTTPSFRDVYDILQKERKEFLLPPYYTVIKVSFENMEEAYRALLIKELSSYHLDWYEQGRGITLLFIHVKTSLWEHDEHVRNTMKHLFFNNKKEVNPLNFFN
ncbi:MAG: hypothetical protein RI935_31 [Candidatus Parcubacteria bacterium]